MSIANEIVRLQNAKTSLKNSLENKGVEVDSNATIDTYYDYVNSITTGEDLNSELNTYETEVTNQETKLNNIIETLKSKGVIEPKELNVTPTADPQTIDGVYNKINVAGDENLIPENIKSGIDIFGVSGTGEMIDFEITDCSYLFSNGVRINQLNDILKLVKNATNMYYMFGMVKNVTSLDLSKLNTSKVTNMNQMFYFANTVKSFNLSSFNTSEVITMSSMFSNCTALTSIDLSNFNTSNATDMSSMFTTCSNLTSINLSSFNTSKVTNMSSMFYNNSKLVELDLSSFDLTKTTNLSQMCYNCKLLEKVTLGGTTVSTSKTTSSMFNGCAKLTKLIIKGDVLLGSSSNLGLTNTPIGNGTGYIYVNDELVDTYKSATNWSTYADQIKPMSELPQEEVNYE